MTSAEAALREGRFAVWCGWVWTVVAGTLPLLAWAWPLGFQVVVPAAGLLCLPAIKVERRDGLWITPLALLVGWALLASTWSPYEPPDLEHNTAAKLALQLPVYLWAILGARAADARGRARALAVLGWASLIAAALILLEALSGAALYQALRQAMHDPIRPDLAARNVAQGVFVLAATGWLGLAGLPRRLAPFAALALAAAVLVGGIALRADAPLLALALSAIAATAVWRFPRGGPTGLAVLAGGLVLATPLILGLLDQAGVLDALKGPAPLSWEQRIGYWQVTLAAIGQQPLIGLGLDGGRVVMGASLHPHSTSLQLWLELGAVGAALAAAAWVAILLGLRGPAPRLAAALAAAAASAYFVFGAFNFGVWQEWWLSLGVFAGAFSVLAWRNSRPVAPQPST
ncbi:MAG: hypothetical protein IT546_00060 [Caulobacteraceae bacterium]|nr:hypothetical protein [Caulobacteraceae bacterium]